MCATRMAGMNKHEARMTKEAPNPNDLNRQPRRKYDLEERTTRFAEAIIDFAKRVAVTAVTEPLVKQLVRSGTSIGANDAEADDAESKKVSISDRHL